MHSEMSCPTFWKHGVIYAWPKGMWKKDPEHTNSISVIRCKCCKYHIIAKGGALITSRIHSRICSLPYYLCSLPTPKNTLKQLHTPWSIAAIIPAVCPLYLSCNDYGCAGKTVSVNINGNCGGAVSCDHVYGPSFGPSDAGDLSIRIATGRHNACSQRRPRHLHRQRPRWLLSPLSYSTPPTLPELSSLAVVTALPRGWSDTLKVN